MGRLMDENFELEIEIYEEEYEKLLKEDEMGRTGHMKGKIKTLELIETISVDAHTKEENDMENVEEVDLANDVREDLEIEEIILSINETLQEHSSIEFTLVGPGQLTVKTSTGFSKASHIGTEVFTIDKVYLGKRKQVIFCLKPKDVAKYVHVEVGQNEFRKNFSGYDAFVKSAGIEGNLLEVRKLHEKRKDMKTYGEKAKKYDGIGWGEW